MLPYLLSIQDSCSKEDVLHIVFASFLYKYNPSHIDHNKLKGKTMAIFFEKKSTRTRLSCSIAWQDLGGNIVDVSPNSGSHGSDEPFNDAFRVIGSMVDVVLARVNHHHTLLDIKDAVKECKGKSVAVINALCDLQHPLQIFADLMTIAENESKRLEKPITNEADVENLLKDVHVAWIGDYNNVYRELAQVLPRLGMHFKAAIPSIRKPQDVTSYTRYEAVKDAQYIMTDTFVSMGDKKSSAELEAFLNFGIDEDLISKPGFLPHPEWKLMHCLPRKGLEILESLFDSDHSIIFQQAENRRWVMYPIFCIMT